MNPPILRPVKGFCPMPKCEGQTLAIDTQGILQCINPVCERPRAVHELLNDVSRLHEVVLTDYDFSLKHPLHERIDDLLFACPLNQFLSNEIRAPQPPGRYLVDRADDGGEPPRWDWTPVG